MCIKKIIPAGKTKRGYTEQATETLIKIYLNNGIVIAAVCFVSKNNLQAHLKKNNKFWFLINGSTICKNISKPTNLIHK